MIISGNPFKLNIKKVEIDGVLCIVINGFDDKIDWDLTYKKLDRMVTSNDL